VTAQTSYAQFVKNHLSPAFRARDWKGSGGRYQKASGTHWIQAGLQKSAWSDRDDVRFTVNLSVISRAEWSARQESKAAPPSPNTHYGWFQQSARLGMLASSSEIDVWWQLDPTTNLETLAIEVMGTFDRFAVPWFTEH
jgi:hypothetical protein